MNAEDKAHYVVHALAEYMDIREDFEHGYATVEDLDSAFNAAVLAVARLGESE